MISATFGVSSLTLTGFASRGEFAPVWLTWWLGDAAGAIIIVPFIVLSLRKLDLNWTYRRKFEVLMAFVCLVVTGYFVFILNFPTAFAILPILIWIAYRFTPREVAAAILILSSIAIWSTLNGLGPFALLSPNESLLTLQGFMSVISFTSMLLAAAKKINLNTPFGLSKTFAPPANLFIR